MEEEGEEKEKEEDGDEDEEEESAKLVSLMNMVADVLNETVQL